jgi:hypothetical protein
MIKLLCKQGTWEEDRYSGKGKYKYWEEEGKEGKGREYVGDWLNGKRNGFGVELYSSGDVYEGYFVNDEKDVGRKEEDMGREGRSILLLIFMMVILLMIKDMVMVFILGKILMIIFLNILVIGKMIKKMVKVLLSLLMGKLLKFFMSMIN